MASIITLSESSRDELDALLSIFPDNFSILKANSIQFEIEEQLLLLIHLPTSYPNTDPPFLLELSLLPQSYPDSSAASLRSLALSAPDALLRLFQPGEPVLFNWYQYLSDELAAISELHRVDPIPVVVLKEEEESSMEEVAVIYIDHMNDSSGYSRKLRKWTRQLGLSALHIFWTTTPTGRCEKIYIFLFGEHESISDFNKRLKTEFVDVNAKSLKCKERKSEMLSRRAKGECSSGSSGGGDKLGFTITEYENTEEGRELLDRMLDEFSASGAASGAGAAQRMYTTLVRQSSDDDHERATFAMLLQNEKLANVETKTTSACSSTSSTSSSTTTTTTITSKNWIFSLKVANFVEINQGSFYHKHTGAWVLVERCLVQGGPPEVFVDRGVKQEDIDHWVRLAFSELEREDPIIVGPGFGVQLVTWIEDYLELDVASSTMG